MIWMASRRANCCQQGRPSHWTLKKTSSCPLQMLAWVFACGFWSWESRSSITESYYQIVFLSPHRMTQHPPSCRLRKTQTPAAPMTTRRTPSRTAAVNQAAAWTTTATGLLSTDPILVTIATSCHSKPSVCQTQRAPAHRTEVTERERCGEKTDLKADYVCSVSETLLF